MRRRGTFGGAGRSCSAWSVADRPAGQLDHFEGADDSAPVVGMEPGGGHGVKGGQAAVERGFAVLEGVALQPQAELAIGSRALEQAAQKRLQVEGRAADEQEPACRALRSRRAPAAAQSRYAATLADSQGSITSIRWCGIPPRSASDGLAVAMSIPRYNVIESSANTSASSRRASATPTAVLPDAVGPVR